MNITPEQLVLALGSKRNWASDEMLNMLNAIDTDGADLVRENWLTYSSVLREGASIEQYTNAVKYVSLKQMGHSNQQAYSIALAERYQEMVSKGYDDKRISSSVAAYHKGAMVQKILAQSTIPIWMLYADEQHKAIKTLVDLMQNANSEKVRCDSANNLLTHIKRPEAALVQLDVTHKQADGMSDLSNMLADLASKQMKVLKDGGDVHVVANLPVVDAEYVEKPIIKE